MALLGKVVPLTVQNQPKRAEEMTDDELESHIAAYRAIPQAGTGWIQQTLSCRAAIRLIQEFWPSFAGARRRDDESETQPRDAAAVAKGPAAAGQVQPSNCGRAATAS
jgi:hypothetical protein